MSKPFKIRIQWHHDTLTLFKYLKAELPWNDFFSVSADTKVAELGDKISAMWEGLYYEHFQDQAHMKTESIFSVGNKEKALPSCDIVGQHIPSGGTVVAKSFFLTPAMIEEMNNPEERKETIRAALRFGLNDRVICNCGTRWLSGHIVGTAVVDEGQLLPYLVKTDPLPGFESDTMSAPWDIDDVVTQEVCFDPTVDFHLIQASTPIVLHSKRSALRFAVGDSVACRLRNAADGLENWQYGHVSAIWAPLHGPSKWEFAGVSGQYADAVPYKVFLDSGKWVLCQADNHTLIRRRGMEPQTRVKGISKRLEIRKLVGGGKEQIDHVTGRTRLLTDDSDESDASDEN
jgi:hypothetical protein